MAIEVHRQPLVVRAMRESTLYAVNKPRAVPPADSPNRPVLEFLFKQALWVRCMRPHAKRFSYEGVQYAIVWTGNRMCVMHVRSGRVLVGAPGERND